MSISALRNLMFLSVIFVGVSAVSAQETGDIPSGTSTAPAETGADPAAPGTDPAEAGTEVATTSPESPDVSRQVVLAQCAIVSLEECTALVKEYMDALVASGLTQEETNQIAADFVVELTAVAQANPEFDQADLNSVDAIRTVITYIQEDDAQVERLATIANTIEANNIFQTAALALDASSN